MSNFFINKKFWLPILLMLMLMIVIEVMLRYGWWNDYVKPNSYLGNAIYRNKALHDWGLDRIEWITVGDSKADWGIDHGKILQSMKLNGNNHIRMSFEGAEFMMMQSVIEWSMTHMPNLKGILLGVSRNNFGQFNNIDRQYKILGPFVSHKDETGYRYYNQDKRIAQWLNRFYLYRYFADIKDFFNNSVQRVKNKKKYLSFQYENIFSFNRSMLGNICDYQLNTLKQCVDEATKIRVNSPSLSLGVNNIIVSHCDTPYAKNRVLNDLPFWSLSDDRVDALRDNWQLLLTKIFDKNIQLKLLLLPDHSFMKYSVTPSNTDNVVGPILNLIADQENAELLDLTKVFLSNKNQKECNYFFEPLHYNDKGRALITQRVVEWFIGGNDIEKNTQHVSKQLIRKTDVINQQGFE